jgi:hypothetical protein
MLSLLWWGQGEAVQAVCILSHLQHYQTATIWSSELSNFELTWHSQVINTWMNKHIFIVQTMLLSCKLAVE